MSKIIKLTKKMPPKDNLQAILPQLLQEANLNISQLSKNTGLANTTIKRMCIDSTCNPTLSSLEKIANFFGITLNQLLGREPLEPNKTGYHPQVEHWKNVPILSLEEALYWPENLEEIKNDLNRVSIKTDLATGECVFAIIGEGEALAPKFIEGTILIFDLEREPKNKDYALILLEGKTLPQFRQIFIDGSDLYAKTINPLLSTENGFMPLSKKTKILGTLIQAKANFVS